MNKFRCHAVESRDTIFSCFELVWISLGLELTPDSLLAREDIPESVKKGVLA